MNFIIISEDSGLPLLMPFDEEQENVEPMSFGSVPEANAFIVLRFGPNGLNKWKVVPVL